MSNNQEAELITLSSDDSDSECEILEDNSKKNNRAAVITGLKADLSRIRGFTPQKNALILTEMGFKACPPSQPPKLNLSNGHRDIDPKDSSSSPEEVVLDEDGENGEMSKKGDPLQNDQPTTSTEDDNASEPMILGISTYDENTVVGGNDEVEVISGSPTEDVLDEDEDSEVASTASLVNYRKQSEDALEAFCKQVQLLPCGKCRIKTNEKAKAIRKLKTAYDSVKDSADSAHMELAEDLNNRTDELKLLPNQCWEIIGHALEIMDPNELGKDSTEKKNKKWQRLMRKAERELDKLNKAIRKYDEMEVDMGDSYDYETDHNSSYIQVEKLKQRFAKVYANLCKIMKCTQVTGRPIQKALRLAKYGASSSYGAIDKAVETFVNKKGFLFIPDYRDILNIVEGVNRSQGLGLRTDEVSKMAQTTFENVVRIIKKRRHKDTTMSLYCHLYKKNGERSEVEQVHNEDELTDEDLKPDPADNDPELKRKLEENKPLMKSESEILEKYCLMAENAGLQAEEVPEVENENDSPPPSDGEDDADEDEDSDMDETDRKNTRALQEAELTEDEDEEPETLRITVENTVNDEDESSNEERLTGMESEADSNANFPVSTNSTNGDTEREENENGNGSLKRKCPDDDDDAGSNSNETDQASNGPNSSESPPSKKIRPDENSNDATLVEKDSN